MSNLCRGYAWQGTLRITGLIDHPDRVTYHDLKEINLKGSLVLFTHHFQYCAADKLPTPEPMAELCRKIG